MWIARIAAVALATGTQIAPVVAEAPHPDANAKSKEMLVRAQSEANRRNAGGLLDQIEAQRRRIDPAEAAKIMPPMPDGVSQSAPAPARPEGAGDSAP
jgi:hypothetical protein